MRGDTVNLKDMEGKDDGWWPRKKEGGRDVVDFHEGGDDLIRSSDSWVGVVILFQMWLGNQGESLVIDHLFSDPIIQ